MKKHLFIASVFILFLNSCTMEKRIYRSGYYVQWRGNAKEMPIQAQKDKKEEIASSEITDIEENLLTLTNNPKGEVINFSEVHEEKLVPASINKNKNNIHEDYHVPKSGSGNFSSRDVTSYKTKEHNKNKSGDGLIYLAAVLMVLTTLGLIRTNRKGVTKLTRWAKANPKKIQALIAGMQLPLVTLAFYLGHNLKELGYDLSDTSTYIFAALTALGFLSVPFWAQRNTIAIPKIVNRQRIGYLGITLSSLMMVTSFGNHFLDKHPDSLVASVITSIDNSILSSSQTHNFGDSQIEIIKESNQNKRIAVSGLSLAAAIILIFLLCIVVCAGVCLVIFGFLFLASGIPLGILSVLAGAGIFWLGVKGMEGVIRKRKETKAERK